MTLAETPSDCSSFARAFNFALAFLIAAMAGAWNTIGP